MSDKRWRWYSSWTRVLLRTRFSLVQGRWLSRWRRCGQWSRICGWSCRWLFGRCGSGAWRRSKGGLFRRLVGRTLSLNLNITSWAWTRRRCRLFRRRQVDGFAWFRRWRGRRLSRRGRVNGWRGFGRRLQCWTRNWGDARWARGRLVWCRCGLFCGFQRRNSCHHSRSWRCRWRVCGFARRCVRWLRRRVTRKGW